jgi:hypothetical protein
MRLVGLLLAIEIMLTPTAYCLQSINTTVTATTSVPLSVRYRFFFRHVETMDAVAADMDKRLQDSTMWRSHDQRASGLTVDEWNFVHATALKCRANLGKNDTAIQELLAKQSVNLPNSSQESDPTLTNLREQRTLIVESAIAAIQKGLGDVAFTKLTQYITAAFPVAVIPQPPTPPLSIPSQSIQMKGSNK